MKKIVLILTAAFAVLPALAEVDFDEYFTDRTLRVDYAFSGTLTSHTISVDGLSRTEGWYGRRSNLDSLLLLGNGRIEMLD